MTDIPRPTLRVRGLAKEFVLHHRGGARLPVLAGFELTAMPGRCVALTGPSGAGKSTLLKLFYANYRANAGAILVRHHGEVVDIAAAGPRTLLELRNETIGYVSQFLRVIPRVDTLDIVAEPLQRRGVEHMEARERAAALLARLNIPKSLFELTPATFSGGERQRVNIARGFIAHSPLLLLDEPTASLDARNKGVVLELIEEAKANGAAVVGIFHDEDALARVADECCAVRPPCTAEAGC
ncbi:phosphonate C-P lyase system protein PhnL [Oceanidesulfovibrio marinus]|uniref:Phosphonate C-P lyase system protein PhnL n=1 Tax=Oceanidesulfovibrio marinus TaxID=370038 RepID=A0A6P1ZD57_9BACT|nr:phosphonate C-P lyase system protein PhnL [Oceanidesulfovibrio marinus]TVM32276.1 phosphonate C-P lyase system protein PhnL [Oceanidesulfovibrio marinus]